MCSKCFYTIGAYYKFAKLHIFKKSKIFFDCLKAKAIHIRIFPRRRHIPNAFAMVFLGFCPY